MAISDSQKVDYLFKKIGYGIAKTDTSTIKSPSNETIASPLVLRGDIIWQQGGDIPALQPSTDTSVVKVYSDALVNSIQCTADSTSSTNRTWLTNLTDWISPEYGGTYQVKLYLDTTGSTTPQTTGTRIYPDGSGNNDEWFFDYASGVLNFIGTNLPSLTYTGKSIFVVGARYIGQKGLASFPGGLTVGNIFINDNSISIVNTDGNLELSANGAGSINAVSNIVASANVTITATTDAILEQYHTGSFVTYGGASIGGNLNVQGNTFIGGNLTVVGNTVSFSANTLTVYDSLIYLAANNETSDLLDIGFVGHYNDGFANAHTGVFRDCVTKEFYVFDGYVDEPTNDIDITDPSFSLANLNVSNITLNNGITISSSDISNVGNINVTTDGLINFVATTAVSLPSGNTAQRPVDLVGGQIRFNSENNIIEFYNGTDWVGLVNGVEDQTIVGDGTNNTFTLTKETTSIGMLVSINGTLQQPDVAYTVSGNQITFAETPLVTDVIDVRFIAVLVTNVETNALIANLAANVNSITNGTATFGNIIPSANVTYSLGSPTAQWKSLYVSSNTIYIGGTALGVANGQLTVGGSSNIATTNYVDTAIGSLVDVAPTALDTLNELAAALNDDASFATTVTTSLGLKANIASPSFTGAPLAPTANISVNNTQLATTAFVHNVLPTGMIIMWSGATSAVPYGWAICNGANGTPDLRDKFVIGAGSGYAVGATGGSKDATLVSHSHTASSTTSTSITDPGHKHWISSMATDDRNLTGTGNNSQEYGLVADAGSYSADDPNRSTGRYSLSAGTGISASSSTSTTVNATGSSATDANLPPYYALCFIMKTV